MQPFGLGVVRLGAGRMGFPALFCPQAPAKGAERAVNTGVTFGPGASVYFSRLRPLQGCGGRYAILPLQGKGNIAAGGGRISQERVTSMIPRGCRFGGLFIRTLPIRACGRGSVGRGQELTLRSALFMWVIFFPVQPAIEPIHGAAGKQPVEGAQHQVAGEMLGQIDARVANQ